MKKKTVSLLLVAAMAVGMLAGCGGGKSSISQDGSSDAAEGNEKAEMADAKDVDGTTITFWHSMGGVNGQAIDTLVKKFNDENEYGITVEAQYQGEYDDSLNKLKSAQIGNMGADLVQVYEIGTRFMIESGWTVPMQEMIDADNYDVSEIEPNLAAYYTIDNQLYSILVNGKEQKLIIKDCYVSLKMQINSISDSNDCRICDLKREFNSQINASSTVVFVVGDRTKYRTAGSNCDRNNKKWYECYCTPYKQNINGKKLCKWTSTSPASDGNVGNINTYSYLRHEFEQAKIKGKPIIIVYNSTRYESSWLPSYMKDYEDNAVPFWLKDTYGNKVGNYSYIKEALGF